MGEGPPVWLKAVLRAERLVGSRVESVVHSDLYFDVIVRTRRSSRRVTDGMESVSKRVLHLANIPAGTDVRRIRAQLARMERRMVDLQKQLEDQQRAAEAAGSSRDGAGATPVPTPEAADPLLSAPGDGDRVSPPSVEPHPG